MRPVKVKICGLTIKEQALEIADLGVDALGFILYPQSKRYIAPQAVKEIIRELPPFVKTVGVFVNEEQKKLREIFFETGLDLVQLHGEESPEDCFTLQEEGIPVIKAFRVKEKLDGALFAQYPLRNILLDAWSEKEYGGTGKQLDWDRVGRDHHSFRLILAGGLTPENIVSAIKKVRPYAIDVSSGVEESPGIKSIPKVKALLAAMEH